jgi:hypothetical protein
MISSTPSAVRCPRPGPFNSYAARQPDNNHVRLWEVAGTAHADAHLIGSVAKYITCGGLANLAFSYLGARNNAPERAFCARDDPSCGRAANPTMAKSCEGDPRNRGRCDGPRNHALAGVATRGSTVWIPATAAATNMDRRLQSSSSVLHAQWSLLGSQRGEPAHCLSPYLARAGRPGITADLAVA